MNNKPEWLAHLPELNFPSYPFRMEKREGIVFIFDSFRKKMVRLTPEEWVRQHAAFYLVDSFGYPAGIISTEAPAKMKGKNFRTDVLVYNAQAQPALLVECKAPSVKITQAVFDQAAAYNYHFHLPYFFLTNGFDHYCCRVDAELKQYHFLETLPDYKSL